MSVILTIYINLIQNTTLHTFSMCFICIRMDNNTPMYTLGDITWTRGRIFPKFSYILKSCHLHIFFIKSKKNTTLHTFIDVLSVCEI